MLQPLGRRPPRNPQRDWSRDSVTGAIWKPIVNLWVLAPQEYVPSIAAAGPQLIDGFRPVRIARGMHVANAGHRSDVSPAGRCESAPDRTWRPKRLQWSHSCGRQKDHRMPGLAGHHSRHRRTGRAAWYAATRHHLRWW